MASLKRIKYAKEPILHVHRYIVACSWPVPASKKDKAHFHTDYLYVPNKKEARALAREVLAKKKDAIVEIYSAAHNYVEGWKA